MTAVCWQTVERPLEDVEWRRYSRKGISETVSQPQTNVYEFRGGTAPQLNLDAYRRELATQPWYGSVHSQLSKFLSYGANWNGYGEKPISEQAVKCAMLVLHRIAMGGPEPMVIPVYHGGIQIEWYYEGLEIEIELPPSSPAAVYIANPNGDSREDIALTLDDPIWDDLHMAILSLKAAYVG